jgi:hypothetical protein
MLRHSNPKECPGLEPLNDMEHIYKYYIHHGVSVYLVASRSPGCENIWSVNLKNVYTPGTGCDTAMVCNGCSPNSFTGFHGDSHYADGRREENLGLTMSTESLHKLICRLNAGFTILNGQVVLY